MRRNNIVSVFFLAYVVACFAWADEPKESLDDFESKLVEIWERYPPSQEESITPQEREVIKLKREELSKKWFEAAKDDPDLIARGIVNQLMHKPFRENTHPMAIGAILIGAEKMYTTKSKLSRAFIERAPYLDDESERWSLELFRFVHGIGKTSDATLVDIMREVSNWLNEYGANSSPESVFISLSLFDNVYYHSFDALDALLEYTGTTEEVLQEWGVSSVEELERPKTPALLNRYLCSKNQWARLFGLNYVRKESSWQGLLDDKACLNTEAEHPLEARWATEVKAKLAAEAAKEEAEAEAGTAEAE